MYTDVAMIQGFVEVVDIMKKGYQVGTASVKSNAPPPCPSGDRGKSRTGRSNGCTHDHCTEAKNQARENLRNVVHPACYPHISSTSPCRKVNC